MEPLHESDTKHTGYRETKPMAKARNRMVQVADLLRSSCINRPPEAKSSGGFALRATGGSPPDCSVPALCRSFPVLLFHPRRILQSQNLILQLFRLVDTMFFNQAQGLFHEIVVSLTCKEISCWKP